MAIDALHHGRLFDTDTRATLSAIVEPTRLGEAHTTLLGVMCGRLTSSSASPVSPGQ